MRRTASVVFKVSGVIALICAFGTVGAAENFTITIGEWIKYLVIFLGIATVSCVVAKALEEER